MFRLTFGVALAMGMTPARLVTSGFFRVHLWVLIGVNTLAALVVYSGRAALAEVLASWGAVFGLAVAAAVLSYVGSVLWLYEKPAPGSAVLFALGCLGLVTAALATPWAPKTTGLGIALAFVDLVSSGLLLGVTLSAMFLGHWYLNTPTMELVPLRRLVAWMMAAIGMRSMLCLIGLLLLAGTTSLPLGMWLWIGLRWLSGLLGTLSIAWMTWLTLKVPNTQSATGLLYAGVLLAFMGELLSQMVSIDRLYPV